MSHIGSGAVILKQGLKNVLQAKPSDPGFNQSVWDEWNAKAPALQVRDALVADNALLVALEAVSLDQRGTFHFVIFDLDFNGFVSLRLGEQAMHTWDVEVALNPAAKLLPDAVGVILHVLLQGRRFFGKANGERKMSTSARRIPIRISPLSSLASRLVWSAHRTPTMLTWCYWLGAFIGLVYGRF